MTVVWLWQILVKKMFQSLFGSLLNRIYCYTNKNLSVKPLSLICFTCVLSLHVDLSVLGKTVPEVLSTAWGPRVRVVLKTDQLQRIIKAYLLLSLKFAFPMFKPRLVHIGKNCDLCLEHHSQPIALGGTLYLGHSFFSNMNLPAGK